MSGSLKDQLIALGLRGSPPKPRRRKAGMGASRRSAKKEQGQEPSLREAWREREQAEQRETADAANRKRAEQLRRQEVNRQIDALVAGQARNDPQAEIKRNFVYKKRIRSVLVNREQLQQLNEGSLGVVFLRGRYLLVEPVILEQVRRLSAEHVPDLAGSGGPDEGDHPVPDDLVW